MHYASLPLKTSTVRARIEPALKHEVESILASLGLTASDAIQLLYRQIRLRNALPFSVEIPNEAAAKPRRESKTSESAERPATNADLYSDFPL
jgi:DNA-damage-inducible protein J